MGSSEISEMLAINVDQKAYYEVASGAAPHAVNSGATNIWRKLRHRVLGVFSTTNFLPSLYALHHKWMGDLSTKKVLELGVGSGSAFSVEMAKTAREYVAVDLSQSRIDELRRKLPDGPTVKLYAGDFLADDFPEGQFDLIYAMSVFHHFKHFGAFLDVVEKRLAPGGEIITYDPVKVWWGLRLLRAVFRPFQTDAAWEHPFGAESMAMIEGRFEVLACQGLMGKSKWAGIIAALSPSLGSRLAQRWHNQDLATKTVTANLNSCLQVSYHLRRRDNVTHT